MSIKRQSTSFGMPPAHRFVLDNKGLLVPSSIISSGAAANPLASVPWVAQWKFNADGNDSIGANNLTNNNAATFTTGKLGGATGATQLAAASSQYWSIADNAALSISNTTDLTIATWIYLDSYATNPRIISKRQDAVNSAEYELFVLNTSHKADFSLLNSAGGGDDVISTPTLSLATWVCIIAWFDAGLATLNISIDDGAVDTIPKTVTVVDSNAAVYIGNLQEISRFFDGRIDNICIAKSAAGGGGILSVAQRTAFYNAGAGMEVIT